MRKDKFMFEVNINWPQLELEPDLFITKKQPDVLYKCRGTKI